MEAPERAVEHTTTAQVTVVQVDDRLPEGFDLGAAVGQVPGVSLRRLGGLGDLSTVSIRGSTERQVEVLIDGLPLNPDGVGAVDLSEYPLRAFERVEVYRGNAPVGMGGTAMGGAVNLVTGDRDVTSASALLGNRETARVHGLLRRTFGGTDVLLATQALTTSGRFRYFVQGAPVDPTDDGYALRENNDVRQGNGLARVSIPIGTARLRLFQLVHGREEGIPGFTAAPLAAVRLQTVQSLTALQLESQGRFPLTARVHVQQRAETLRDPASELNSGGTNRFLVSGGRLMGRVATASWWRLGWLVDGRYEAVRDQGARQVGRAELGGWFRRGPVRVEPALAAVVLRSQGAGEAVGVQVLPRLGASLALSEDVLIKANGGRTFRPPDLVELFGNRGPLVGRSDLRPERGWNADLSVRGRGSWGFVELGGWLNRSQDLIVYLQNAQGAAVPGNLGRSGVEGLEGALQLVTIPFVESQTNLTLQRTRNLSADPIYRGRQLPRQPLFQWDQRLAFVLPWLRLGYGLSFTAGVYTDALNQVRQPPRPLHTLYGRVDLGPVQLAVDLQNLLDTKTVQGPLNPLDPEGIRGPSALADYVGYPLPGRTLLVTLRYQAP